MHALLWPKGGHRGLEGCVGVLEVAGCGLQWRGNLAKLNGDDGRGKWKWYNRQEIKMRERESMVNTA